jgi:hypothetical protein
VAKILYDFYQWMPGHGKNAVSVNYEGTTVAICVRFDGIEGVEETKTLKFSGVSYCAAGAFPGLSVVGGYELSEFRPGCVIEADRSDLSAQWAEYWLKSIQRKRACRHFVMF